MSRMAQKKKKDLLTLLRVRHGLSSEGFMSNVQKTGKFLRRGVSLFLLRLMPESHLPTKRLMTQWFREIHLSVTKLQKTKCVARDQELQTRPTRETGSVFTPPTLQGAQRWEKSVPDMLEMTPRDLVFHPVAKKPPLLLIKQVVYLEAGKMPTPRTATVERTWQMTAETQGG